MWERYLWVGRVGCKGGWRPVWAPLSLGGRGEGVNDFLRVVVVVDVVVDGVVE